MSRLIIVNGVKGTKVLNYIDELKSKGLVVGQDFEWYFVQEDKILKVDFFEEKYATFYQIKWSSK